DIDSLLGERDLLPPSSSAASSSSSPSSSIMVELVGVMSGVDEWPSDMDTRVAALDFADSILSIDASSSFEPSLSTYDPSLSTDSLDSEQLRQRCEHKTDDYKLTFADSGQWTTSTHLTTWGRIQYSQPFEEKIVSSPEVRVPCSSPSLLHRPSSLLIDFVGRHTGEIKGFVDVNENIEEGRNSSLKKERWKWGNGMRTSSHRMKRTFADLEEAPELNFLQLPHQTRALTESTSLPEGLGEGGETSLGLDSLLLQPSSPPDSGLGCSGPLHIEDWASLSVLLPKHVAEACVFFTKNSDLLGASNCVERSSRSGNEPCTTCFRVRRKGLLHPPGWALSSHSRITLCDCTKSEFTPRPIGRSATFSTTPGLASRELAIVGLPVYSEARRLVESIVEGVAISIRGDGEDSLAEGIVALLSHRINNSFHPWEVITAVTAPGPATKKIHSLVSSLSSSDRSPDASLHVFIHALIIDCSLECWLSYVLLKEKTLHPFYRPSSFLLSAPSSYRSLLNRLLQSLQLLSIHDSTEPRVSHSRAARIPSDSRVPKSSSVPARLSPSLSQSSFRHSRRPSRIPQPRTRVNTPSTSRTSFLSSHALTPIEARVKESSAEPKFPVSEGERLKILATRGSYAHCYRLRRQRGRVMNGVVPLTNLSIN
ncbi:hypothetical protein PMAYCL1PPCAC_23648, partial [Pristionchus mayeri]